MTWLAEDYEPDAEASYLAAIVEPMAFCPECGGTSRWYDEAWGGERVCECQPPQPAPGQMTWADVPQSPEYGPNARAGW